MGPKASEARGRRGARDAPRESAPSPQWRDATIAGAGVHWTRPVRSMARSPSPALSNWPDARHRAFFFAGARSHKVARAGGIEPPSTAIAAVDLPLNYARLLSDSWVASVRGDGSRGMGRWRP